MGILSANFVSGSQRKTLKLIHLPFVIEGKQHSQFDAKDDQTDAVSAVIHPRRSLYDGARRQKRNSLFAFWDSADVRNKFLSFISKLT